MWRFFVLDCVRILVHVQTYDDPRYDRMSAMSCLQTHLHFFLYGCHVFGFRSRWWLCVCVLSACKVFSRIGSASFRMCLELIICYFCTGRELAVSSIVLYGSEKLLDFVRYIS